MKLSVVMPAQNEEDSVGATVEGVVAALEREGIDYEVVVVDDDSEDSTGAVVAAIAGRNPRVRAHRSPNERGFGNAIRAGPRCLRGRRGGDHDGRRLRRSRGPRPLPPAA